MVTAAKKAESATQTPVLKNATKKQEKPAKSTKSTKPAATKKQVAPAVKTVLSPTAAWPFPTGPRP